MISKAKAKEKMRVVRHKRVRSKVKGTPARPRLSVFKSNKQISAQIVDDTKATTLASSTSLKIKGKNLGEKAKNVGLDIAKKAKSKKIDSVLFDRGGYIFTGNIKKLAEGAREGGLKF